MVFHSKLTVAHISPKWHFITHTHTTKRNIRFNVHFVFVFFFFLNIMSIDLPVELRFDLYSNGEFHGQ